MSTSLEYTVFETALGWVGVLASQQGLRATSLPRPSEKLAKQELGIGTESAVESTAGIAGLVQRLKAYFSGEDVPFRDKLDLSAATPFQRAVWEQTRLIPFGETRSYLWIAGKIGKPLAARAVGNALGRNPLPIIVPCHRVLASGGGLGGFSGGLEMKRRLLTLEKAG